VRNGPAVGVEEFGVDTGDGVRDPRNFEVVDVFEPEKDFENVWVMVRGIEVVAKHERRLNDVRELKLVRSRGERTSKSQNGLD
jgi:hypothetical protein